MLAVIIAASLASICQSVFNLVAISTLTGKISSVLWLHTILYDLRYFMPVLAAIFLPVMLISLLATALLRRYLSLSLYATSAGVGALGTWLALLVINQLAPMPTLIALNRTIAGTLLLLVSVGVGLVFYQIWRKKVTLETKGAAA